MFKRSGALVGMSREGKKVKRMWFYVPTHCCMPVVVRVQMVTLGAVSAVN